MRSKLCDAYNSREGPGIGKLTSQRRAEWKRVSFVYYITIRYECIYQHAMSCPSCMNTFHAPTDNGA